jgi:hypothetical protein
VFPLPESELNRLAYYFEFDGSGATDPVHYTRGMRRACRQWQHCWDVPPRSRPRLDLRMTRRGVVITDTRPCAVRREHRLPTLAGEIYLRCDTARTVAGLAEEFDGRASSREVLRTLQSLRRARLLLAAEGQYLSLAVFRDRPQSAGIEWDSQAGNEMTPAARNVASS